MNDVNWKNGRSWSLVYYAGEEHTDFLKQVYNLYFSENAAGPSLFPSLQLMEAEVVSMVANLLGGDVIRCENPPIDMNLNLSFLLKRLSLYS